jgi:LeuA allosteric (dimerisation) domain
MPQSARAERSGGQRAPQPPDSNAVVSPSGAFSVERWSATSGNNRPSRASLAVRGAGRTWRAHSEGNGGVDALLRAADLALAPFLGKGVELETFNVHAVGTGHDAAASVTLSIQSRGGSADHAPAYNGRGVHANVLEASVIAYVDAINRLLAHGKVDVAALAAAAHPPRERTKALEHETRQRRLEPLMGVYNA